MTTGGSKEWGRGQALFGSLCGRWWHITVLLCSSVSSTQGSAPRVWGYLPAPWCLVAAVSRGRHLHALHRKASGGWEAKVRPEAGARRGLGGKDPSPQVGMLSPPSPMTSWGSYLSHTSFQPLRTPSHCPLHTPDSRGPSLCCQSHGCYLESTGHPRLTVSTTHTPSHLSLVTAPQGTETAIPSL